MSARALAIGLALAVGGCGESQTGPAQAPERAAAEPVAAVLAGAQVDGYARALAPRAFDFPRDHGSHPDFRSEWWYFTGNLRSEAGRAFGFQLTFFRFALAATAPERSSAWATRQAWMAHFALTDVGAERFHAFERFARGAAGLAGAEAAPFRVWLEDWEARALQGEHAFPMRLRASAGDVAIDLVLQEGKPRVLQGDRGLSRKSAQPGNASYYYSYTRPDAAGRMRTPAGEFAVRGHAWLDREWSTSALAPDQAGWDWFALQLDDGRDLMFYRLRTRDGGMHPFSAGVLVAAGGAVTRLGADDVALWPGRRWGEEGAGYPVEWRMAVAGLDLEVRAMLDAQVHSGRFRYWEGAVQVAGSGPHGAVGGRGYLEMTGY